MQKLNLTFKLCALMLFLNQQIIAQTPSFSLNTHTIGKGNENSFKIAADKWGNFYHSGGMGIDSFSIEGTTLNPFKVGFVQSFLARHSSNSSQNWAMRVGGSNIAFVSGIATDPSGNLIAVFTFMTKIGDTVRIGDKYSKIAEGENLSLVVKMDSLANIIWSKEIIDTSHVGFVSQMKLTVDVEGNFYIAGFCAVGQVFFDTFSVKPIGPFDSQFVVKGDANGNFKWVKSYGSKSNDGQGFDITVNENKEVFVSGSWEGDTLFLDNLIIVNPNPGGFFNTDRYIFKINSLGETSWLLREGGPGSLSAASCAPDAKGGVSCAALNTGEPITLNEGLTTLSGSFILLTRYNENGKFVSFDTFPFVNSEVTLNASGGDGIDYYLGFSFNQPTYTINGNVLTNKGNTSGTSDIAIVKLDTAGNVLWATSLGAEEDELLSFATYSSINGLMVAGSTTSAELMFSNKKLTNAGLLTSEGMISSVSVKVGLNDNIEQLSLQVFPNPAQDMITIDFDNLVARTAEINIVNTMGALMMQSSLDLSENNTIQVKDLKPGFYLLQIKVGENYLVKKFIKE